MKKLAIIIITLILGQKISAQVFNTAEILKQGTFSVGVEPMILARSGSDYMLFAHVGYGLTKDIDIAAKAGVLGGANYLGGDMEVSFMKNLSLSAGAHIWGDFGFDATLLGTYDLAKNVNLYGGLDGDLDFGNRPYLNLWVPIGVEVALGNNMAFLMEASVGVTNSAPHMFGGGINVYF